MLRVRFGRVYGDARRLAHALDGGVVETAGAVDVHGGEVELGEAIAEAPADVPADDPVRDPTRRKKAILKSCHQKKNKKTFNIHQTMHKKYTKQQQKLRNNQSSCKICSTENDALQSYLVISPRSLF